MSNESSYTWPLDFPVPPATLLPPPEPIAPTTVEADFGTDFALDEAGDLDATFRLEAGDRMLKLALARRLLTPRGALDFHPDYGLDLRQFLNRQIDLAGLEQIKSAVENELEKDARVAQAECIVQYDTSTNEITIECSLETQRGPFELTMLVSNSVLQLR